MSNIPRTAVTLTDELNHLREVPDGWDYWEDTGHFVVAQSEGQDILLWTGLYAWRDATGVQYLPDASVQVTNLVIVPSERRGKGMYDNNFARGGWYPTEFRKLPELEVAPESDRVTWRLEGRRHVCRPPVWEIKGEHAGVDLDLTFRQCAPALWHHGPFDKLVSQDMAGYHLPCTVEGSIAVGAKSYPVRNGFSNREHLAFLRSNTIISGNPVTAPITWYFIGGATDDLVMYLSVAPGLGLHLGAVQVEGTNIVYLPHMGHGSVNFTTLEHWHDPRSGFYVPNKWQLTMASPQGTLVLNFSGHGRGYYPFFLRKGLAWAMWIVCSADGAFYFADGRSFPINNTLLSLEYGKANMVAEEFLDGPPPV